MRPCSVNAFSQRQAYLELCQLEGSKRIHRTLYVIFRSFEKNLVPVLVSKRIAVLGMKSMGDSHILASKTVTPLECLQYALSLPTSVVITGIDSMQILDQAFKAANSYDKLTKADIAAILNKTTPVAMDGKYEPFKTSPIFDSTAAHPEWLGYNPQA